MRKALTASVAGSIAMRSICPLERRDKLDTNEIIVRLWFVQQRDLSNDLV